MNTSLRNTLHMPIAKAIIMLVLMWCMAFTASSQGITIVDNNNNQTSSATPLLADSKDVIVLGMTTNKAAGGSSQITQIVVTFNTDPAGTYTNARLMRSDDGNFDAGDQIAATGTFGTNSITFAAAPITSYNGGDVNAVTRTFFLLVDVAPGVTAVTPAIKATFTSANITAGSSVTGTAVDGDTYTFVEQKTTVASLSGGIAPSPLGGGTTDRAVLGFSLDSDGDQDFNGIVIHTTSAAAGKITNIRIFSSSDNTFGGGDTNLGITPTVTGTTITFTGLTESLSATKYYFIVADIVAGANAATPQLQLSFDDSDVDVSDGAVQTAAITGIDYAFNDVTPPTVVSVTPADDATGISIGLSSLQITFNENVSLMASYDSDDAHRIRIKNVTDNTFVTVPAASINIVSAVATINISTLTAGKNYAIYIGASVFQDVSNNAFTGYNNDTSWNFQVEDGPAITGYSADPTCMGESINITGTNFGAAIPTVTINGVATTVTANSATSITITVPTTSAGNATVVVRNNSNTLTDSDNSLTLKPALANTLPLSVTPAGPATGQNYSIQVASTQTIAQYRVRELPAAFSGSTTGGTGGTISLGTFNHVLPGTYQYEVEASSNGCTTRTYGVLDVVIAQLDADAGPDKIICQNETVSIGGSPTASGGTGFFNIQWTTLPSNTYFSSQSNPQVKPSVTTAYRVVVYDGPSSFTSDTLQVTVKSATPATDLDIELSPSKPNNTYQKEDTEPVTLTFKVGGSPGSFIGTTRFEGPGVNTNGPTKYFYPNAANVGGNQIDLYYQNANGCITKDSTFVFIRDKNSFVTGLQDQYCRDNAAENLTVQTPIIVAPFGFQFCFPSCFDYTYSQGRRYTYLGRTRVRNIATNDTIANTLAYSYSGANLQINTEYMTAGAKQFEIFYRVEILDWSSLPPGYIVTAATPFTEIVTVPFDVLEKPVVIESMPNQACENQAPFILEVQPSGGDFTLNGSATTNTFDPSTSGYPNINTIRYTYTDPKTSCSNSVQRIITINRLPVIDDISFSNGCVNDTITFTPFFTNPDNIVFSYLWDVDGIDGFEAKNPTNVSVPIYHRYNIPSNYPIRLQVTTAANCVTQRDESLVIGEVPDVKILWSNVCDGDNTRFSFASNFFKNNLNDVDSIKWNFGDATALIEKKSPVATDSVQMHMYASTDYFKASVSMRTDLNCRISDSVRIYKVVRTAPIEQQGYFENFDKAVFEDQQWKTGGTKNSWEWGQPSKAVISSDASGAGKAWVTNLDGFYNTNEDSWVHSPCLDLSQIQRPVLSIDFKSLTPESIDGAVLQYNYKNTTNKESDWQTLGAVGVGKNWYNKIGIGANPGNQSLLQTGWTGQIDSTAWRTGTMALDNMLNGIPLGQRDRVRFRLAFGSSEFAPKAEGFAFDNFRITQRDRLVLIEQFANNGGSNPASDANRAVNTQINNFITTSSGELVKLEYHIGISGPNDDPLYLDNTMDASARAAYYGVTSTPSVFMDARVSNGQATFQSNLSEETLKATLVRIDTIITRNTPADKLNIEVKFTAAENLPKNTVLHVAVIETEIIDAKARGSNGETSFKHVVKKLLPDATGTRFTEAIAKNSSRTVNVSWSPKAYNFDSLAIVVFVQNQDTKEIYQARYAEPTYIPNANTVTGFEPAFADQIGIYPNPAVGEVNVILPMKANQPMPVALIDGFGREVYRNTFNAGEQSKNINTQQWAPGVYVLQIKSASGDVARRKIVIANH